MAREDKKKVTFIIWETFCYKVMPFELKNVKATYQRAIMTLFYDMIYKEIRVYVDDIIDKSKREEDHVQILIKLLDRLRKYQLKLNSINCLFGIKFGKLLKFMMNNKGIEVDSDKVKDIQVMTVPKTKKKV